MSIINNSFNFSDIVYCELWCKHGDVFVSLVDGANKRIGIMIYSSDIPNSFSEPGKVLGIKTSGNSNFFQNRLCKLG